MDKPFTIRARVMSFAHAFQGLGHMLRTEHNVWLHALSTVIVTAVCFYFGLTRLEWCWIVLAMALVWTAEGMNTAFEYLADAVHPERSEKIRHAKDTAAAAVLLASLGAVIIGLLVMGPHLIRVLRGFSGGG
jgi:diacylglycerol kinase (ATP)